MHKDIHKKKIMNLPELHTTWVTTWLTVLFVGIILWYLWLIKLPIEHSRKEREVELIQKKLEKFYFPLQNALVSGMYDENLIGQSYVKAKATALNNAVNEVLKYSNLSSSELRPLIQRFSSIFHYINHPADFALDAGIAYDEILDSLDKIEELITKDIMEYSKKLDKLTQ